MYYELNDRIVDRIAAAASLIAFASAAMLWREHLYPISMLVDSISGLVLALVYIFRKSFPSQQRMAVIALAGLFIGVTAIYQTPLYADGYLVLGGVMVLSFTSWWGWRAWVLPLVAVACVLVVALAISTGVLDFNSEEASPDLNSFSIWIITAMTIALLALGMGGAIGDLKKRLKLELTKLEAANKTLFLSAYTDPTTGLSNRHRLEEVVNSASKAGQHGCLLVIDIANLRHFNALHGHVKGDEILLSISKLLSRSAHSHFFISAFAGGQFGIWMPATKTTQALEFFDYFAEIFSREFDSSKGLSLSAGLVELDEHAESFNTLLKNMAVALGDAKTKKGMICSVFSPVMSKAIETEHSLKITVRNALDAQTFFPVYQTKVNSSTGKVCGVEGLARMRSTDAQRAPGPGEFIPIIHREGWMIEFGMFMLRAIMRDIPHLVSLYGVDTKVSINISPPLFIAPEFLPLFIASIDELKVDPKNIVIEITEEVFASSLEEIVTVTNTIRKLGADVSLDDFGAGFSSLSYLREVHFDEIKIDRSFVEAIEHDLRSKILLSAMTKLGLELGSRLVTEGVETQAQLHMVQSAGCEIIQGFFYSKPTPLDTLVGDV